MDTTLSEEMTPGLSQVFNVLTMTPDQIKEIQTTVDHIDIPRLYDVDHIVLPGFGENAIASELLFWYLNDKSTIPITLTSSEKLPKWANKHTLICPMNYSGNDPGLLHIFKEADQKHCKILTSCAGGRLQTYCKHRQLPCLPLSSELLSQFTNELLLVSMLSGFVKTGLFPQTIKKEIQETQKILSELKKTMLPTVSKEKNLAKQISEHIKKSIPFFFGAEEYGSLAKYWSQQFNRNSKTSSFFYSVPDFSFHALEALTKNQPFSFGLNSVMFRDTSQESRELKIQLNFIETFCEDISSPPLIINPEGKSRLAKLLWLTYLGEFSSVYTAQIQGTDPSSSLMIDQIQRQLSE